MAKLKQIIQEYEELVGQGMTPDEAKQEMTNRYGAYIVTEIVKWEEVKYGEH